MKEKGMDRHSRWSEKLLVSQVVQPGWVLKGGLHAGKGLVVASVSPGHRIILPFRVRDQGRWNVLEARDPTNCLPHWAGNGLVSLTRSLETIFEVCLELEGSSWYHSRLNSHWLLDQPWLSVGG